ncbi:MAG: hypothetical protein Q9157_002191 [Trypethelium eluteriae]
MGQFWVSWVLWEKMCFILACGIVTSLFLGSLKLAYFHWRIRKYSRLATEKRNPAPDPPINPQSRRDNEAGIPFGIRAIEQGVEVEGVYISRPNSPASTPRASRLSSLWNEPAIAREFSSGDAVHQASLSAQPLLTNSIPTLPFLQSSNEAAWASTFSFERSSTPEHLQTPSSVSLALEQLHLQPTSQINGDRPSDDLQKPPKIYLIGSSDDALRQRAQEGRKVDNFGIIDEQPEHRASLFLGLNEDTTTRRGSNESQQTTSSLQDSENLRDRADSQALLLPKTRAGSAMSTNSQYSYVDLESMHAHRLSHAAETGQLTPRSWRKDPSPSSGKQSDTSSSNDEPVDYFSSKSQQTSARSSTRVKYEFASGFQFPSKIVEAHRAVSFPSTKSALEALAIQSTATETAPATLSDATAIQCLVPDPVALPREQSQQPDSPLDQPTPPQEASQQTTAQGFEPESRNQVIRKVNSGFFVLRCGSLPARVEQSESQLQSESAPARESRKLQKRRGSTSTERSRESRMSFVVHRVSQDGQRYSEDGKRAELKEARRVSWGGEGRGPERKLQKKKPQRELRKQSSFEEHI